jgi:hypothetical protein
MRVPFTLPLLLLCTACAPQYASIAMGQYDLFRPYARVYSATIDIELARPAHVAVISIIAPAPGYNERPVLFEARYPQWDTDETHFAAGEHRLLPRRMTLRDPRNCRDTEKPSLSGCRRPRYMYIGAGAPNELSQIYQSDPSHYLVIASEEFIDPFTLADDLFDMAFERPELGTALKTRKAHEAGDVLERALLDRPGPPMWAAFYVSGK